MTVKSSRPPRTLNDIKTVAGKSTEKTQRSYANYFQMGALELERWRRGQEREAAEKRVGEIDRRMAEIDAQMQSLQNEVAAVSNPRPATPRRRGQQQADARTGTRRVTTDKGVQGERTEPGERRGLRIRY
jgi:hypothetical protein